MDKSSGRKAQEKGQAEIPICGKKLGTIAVVEPDTNWWQQLGLGSPEAIIKVFVMKSRCFGLVDRGKGMAQRSFERELADSGELQSGSNIGKRQVKAADYFVVPDLVTKNSNSGGNALGGIVGGFLGGRTLGAGAGGFFGGGFGAVGGGGYQDTDIGQVIVLAYLDAYTKMVTEMGGLPENPSAAAPAAQ